MSNPFTANWRIVLPYTIDGLVHTLHEFVTGTLPGGFTYTVQIRTGGNIQWEYCVEDYAAALSYIMATATTPGTALLQELVSNSWLTRASHTVTLPNSSSTYVKASQMTMVMKDNANNIMRTLVLEGAVDLPRHWGSYAALPAGPFQDMAKEFTAAYVGTAPPYNWLVSGQEENIRPDGIVGVTTALNKKVRRARGLV